MTVGMGVGYHVSYAFLRACTENWVGQFLNFSKAPVNDLLARETGQVCLPVRALFLLLLSINATCNRSTVVCCVVPVEASDLGIVTWVLLTFD